MSKCKGRLIMRSKNNALIFLGSYLAVGIMFLAFCTRYLTFGRSSRT